MKNNQDIQIIENVLYDDTIDSIEIINKISNKETLHIIATKYNWDDGFKIPNLIADHERCDLGTALLLFDLADGYRLIDDPDSIDNSNNIEWRNFLNKLYIKISEDRYSTKDITYKPSISKVQAYKLKKSNPNILDIFLIGNEGTNIEIPNI